VPWYPLVPAVFCLSSLFMLWSSLSWAYENVVAAIHAAPGTSGYDVRWSIGVSVGLSIGIMTVGVVLGWFDRR
jgi:hypothetical protein